MTSNIAFICDDNYCMPTAVCIRSIINHYTLSQALRIHVCTFGLSRDNEERLVSMSTPRVIITVDVFSETKYGDLMKKVSQKTHVTPTALIKFELPTFFSDIDTLLYLDSDIVVKGDFSELLHLDIGDNYLAASYEFWEYLRIIRYSLKRSAGDFYFNSGVMLLNLKQMRKDKISRALWEYKINKAKTKLMDQESLNAVCGSKAVSLPIKWNFNPLFNANIYVSHINMLYHQVYKNVMDIIDDVRIIHYVGLKDKPWLFKNARMRQYWDECFVCTPYVQELELEVATSERRSFREAVWGTIKEHGLWGAFCSIIYELENKVKR